MKRLVVEGIAAIVALVSILFMSSSYTNAQEIKFVLRVAPYNALDSSKAVADVLLTGQHDTQDLQSAVRRLPTVGGKLQFYEGDILTNLNEPIADGKNGLTIIGEGSATRFKLKSGTIANVLCFRLVPRLHLQDFGEDGTSSIPSQNRDDNQCGIYLAGCDDFLIERVPVKNNVGHGFYIVSSGDGLLDRVTSLYNHYNLLISHSSFDTVTNSTFKYAKVNGIGSADTVRFLKILNSNSSYNNSSGVCDDAYMTFIASNNFVSNGMWGVVRGDPVAHHSQNATTLKTLNIFDGNLKGEVSP